MLIQIMAHKLMGSRRRLACGKIKQEKFFCTWGNSLKIPSSALWRGGPASEFFTFQEKRKWDLLWIQSARLRTFANKSGGPLFWLPTRGVAIRKDWHKKKVVWKGVLKTVFWWVVVTLKWLRLNLAVVGGPGRPLANLVDGLWFFMLVET